MDGVITGRNVTAHESPAVCVFFGSTLSTSPISNILTVNGIQCVAVAAHASGPAITLFLPERCLSGCKVHVISIAKQYQEHQPHLSGRAVRGGHNSDVPWHHAPVDRPDLYRGQWDFVDLAH